MAGSARLAGIALLLLGASAANAAAADGARAPAPQDAAAMANLSSVRLTGRAQRPTYGAGGWRCPPGFVWRNAGKKDWLCVDAWEAQRIAWENRQAAKSWVQKPDGGRACRSGLVPRDAFKGDIVCVDPSRRESIKTMNVALYTDL